MGIANQEGSASPPIGGGNPGSGHCSPKAGPESPGSSAASDRGGDCWPTRKFSEYGRSSRRAKLPPRSRCRPAVAATPQMLAGLYSFLHSTGLTYDQVAQVGTILGACVPPAPPAPCPRTSPRLSPTWFSNNRSQWLDSLRAWPLSS